MNTNHTDSVEAHESLVYEVKQQILWDYSYYVSREQSVNGYWKRVSSIDDIPLHAIGSYKTHPVEEPDNLFLFKVYQYLLTQSQQVEEAVERVAKAIYDEMVCDDPRGKPDWVPRGNLIKQVEARRKALQALTPNHQD